jgi:peroxin-1
MKFNAVLFLDDIDSLCATDSDLADPSVTSAVANALRTLLNLHAVGESGVAVVASCCDSSAVSPDILCMRLFSKILKLQQPSRSVRTDILMQVLQDHGTTVPDRISSESDAASSEFDLLDPAVNATEGCSAGDVCLLGLRLVVAARQHAQSALLDASESTLVPSLVTQCVASFAPSSSRHLNLKSSEFSFSDVGAMMAVKSRLQRALMIPLKFPRIFDLCKTRARSGALLFGPAGCGKTLIAAACAGECKVNFISVSGPELLNKYIGASERGVRNVFRDAEAAKPCVLFFDEFESICPRRGADHTGVTDRVVNQVRVSCFNIQCLRIASHLFIIYFLGKKKNN